MHDEQEIRCEVCGRVIRDDEDAFLCERCDAVMCCDCYMVDYSDNFVCPDCYDFEEEQYHRNHGPLF